MNFHGHLKFFSHSRHPCHRRQDDEILRITRKNLTRRLGVSRQRAIEKNLEKFPEFQFNPKTAKWNLISIQTLHDAQQRSMGNVTKMLLKRLALYSFPHSSTWELSTNWQVESK